MRPPDKSGSVSREVAGALARFWSHGAGPSHAALGTALALAGYDEPDEDTTANKEQRVLLAFRKADVETAARLVDELLSILRSSGYFDGPEFTPPVASLRTALERGGHSLAAGGYIQWSARPRQTESTEHPVAHGDTPALQEGEPAETTVPTVELLTSCLRRLPSALRPLAVRRRDAEPFHVRTEYDMQDVVEALLRSFYPDVRPEERTQSHAGSGSVMDFLIRDAGVAVEVKVTRQGRGERQIKQELLVDINDYQRHSSVQTLIAVVYDIAATFSNSTGFERDMTSRRDALDVVVIVVGWPLPPTTHTAVPSELLSNATARAAVGDPSLDTVLDFSPSTSRLQFGVDGQPTGRFLGWEIANRGATAVAELKAAAFDWNGRLHATTAWRPPSRQIPSVIPLQFDFGIDTDIFPADGHAFLPIAMSGENPPTGVVVTFSGWGKGGHHLGPGEWHTEVRIHARGFREYRLAAAFQWDEGDPLSLRFIDDGVQTKPQPGGHSGVANGVGGS
jgi:hypothetical protein